MPKVYVGKKSFGFLYEKKSKKREKICYISILVCFITNFDDIRHFV